MVIENRLVHQEISWVGSPESPSRLVDRSVCPPLSRGLQFAGGKLGLRDEHPIFGLIWFAFSDALTGLIAFIPVYPGLKPMRVNIRKRLLKRPEGCFSAVPACPPWSRESETKEERSRLIASGSLRHVALKAAKHH
jgi:hypothetical protein